MRQVTATEKFRAVNEGKMAKGEFVRQMRMAYPSVISQWNSYNDTVTILKNRGYITEKTGVDIYDSRHSLNISTESIDRGVRYELAAQGHDPAEVKDKQIVDNVTDRVIKNLKKDPLHYINLLAKESSHVDKNDKMKETKRGAADKDTFNDLKKATLKEGYTEEQINDAIERIKERKAGEHADGTPKSNDEMDDDEKNDFYDNLDSVDENSEKENVIAVAREIRAKYGDIPGFNRLLKDFLQTHMDDVKSGAVSDPIAEFDNFVDANYDRLNEKEGKDHDGDGDIDSDDYLAAKDKAIKKAMGKDEAINEMDPAMADAIAALLSGAGIVGSSALVGKLLDAMKAGKFGDRGIKLAKDIEDLGSAAADATQKHEGQINERGFHVMRQIKGIIQDMAADFDGDEVGAAEELMEAIGQEYGIDFEFGAGESRQQEALKESVKNIITKVLEEQVINEAATNELARIADEYEDFDGLKQTIVALHNIVTEIESFYDKTRDKIQKVYDSIGEVRNEEGLKVGAFLAPSIESAFNKDLRPIAKKGFTKGLDTPKVKTISSAEVDAARAAGEIEEEPKQTMFTPIAES